MHTKDDPKDHLENSTYNIVDHAYELGFNVLSLTCHQTFVYKKEYTEYAKRKGILLIPGIELLVEKKHNVQVPVVLNLFAAKLRIFHCYYL